MSNLTDDQLFKYVDKLGREMTASSSNMAMAKEKERIIYIKELMKRGKIGYASKKKYRP